MRKLKQLLWVVLLVLPLGASAQQTYLWTGLINSNWSVSGNWLSFGPGIGTFPNTPTDIAIVIPVLTPPVLSTNIVVGSLVSSFTSSINLNTHTLTVGGGNVLGTTISNGKIRHTGSDPMIPLNISGSTLTNVIFEKDSKGVTNFQNGNIFNAPNRVEMLSGAASIQMGVITGDVFNGNALFINHSDATLSVGLESATTFTGNISLEQTTPGGEIVFGANLGTSTLSSGSILGSSIVNGTIYLGGIIQQNSAAVNTIGSIMGGPSILDIANSNFAGNFSGWSSNSLFIFNSQIKGSLNYFEAPQIVNVRDSDFNNAGAGTTFKKTTAALLSDDWYGGNRYGNCNFINESNFNLRLNTAKRDTFYQTATFNNIGNGFLWAAAIDSSHFASHVFINNLSPNGMRIGSTTAGLATIGGNIKTTGFTNGPLELWRLDQMATTANDPLAPRTLFVKIARLRGDFSCIATNSIALDSSIFNRNNTFQAPDITQVVSCSFSGVAGRSSTFTKTGGVNNNWSGNNIFGEVRIINSSANVLSMASVGSSADVFNQKATFQQMDAGGDLNPCSNSNCRFRDTLSTLGTAKQIVFGGVSSGRVFIDGDVSQVLQGDNVLPPVFRRLTMSTTGDLTLDVPLTLRTPGASTFTNGIIRTSATNILFYDAAASPIGMSNASHVDGPVRRSSSAASSSFIFPTGDNNQYAPVTIAKSAGAGPFGSFDVEYFNTAFSSDVVDATLDHVSGCEYWDIARTAGTEAVDLMMTWDDTRSCGITDLSSLTGAHYSGGTWTNTPATVFGSLPSGTVVVSGVASFGPFTLASTNAANPLPIELLFFTAKPNDNVVDLAWATASEKDNDYFTVERSRDGSRFEQVLRVNGAGTSTERLPYADVDLRPLPGISYYRLRQTDYNGQSSLSNVVAVQMPVSEKVFSVYPNPAQDFFYLDAGAALSAVRCRLINSIGETIPVAPQMDADRLRFSTHGLIAGLYFLEVQMEDTIQSFKVIIR